MAIVSATAALTWQQLDESSERLARSYLRLGLEPGDRVATLMPNRLELMVHYLACFKAGLVATPLNYRYAAPQIDHALALSGSRLLVAHVERTRDIEQSDTAGSVDLGTIWFDETDGTGAGPTFESLLSEPAESAGLDLPHLDDPAIMFFTSGSTGPAKGVTHTFRSLGSILAITSAALDMTAADVSLPASSMAHIGGFRKSFTALSAGARVVLAHTFDAAEVLHLLREERPTLLSMIPAALTLLVRDHGATRDDFRSLRLLAAAGDKVPPELDDEAEHVTRLLVDEGYAMTEAGLMAMNPPHGEIRPGSVGKALPGVRMTLRDRSDKEVAPGTVGNLWVNTPGLMKGYWNDHIATEKVLRDGWMDTGDEASVDEDGYLWFFGRKKQIIVHDGSNISPLEVEAAIGGHQAVDSVGVVGIHDEVHGESVRAYVIVVEGQPRPGAQELIDFARSRIGYRAPEEIVFLDSMPLNATGKVDRAQLKQLAAESVGSWESGSDRTAGQP